MNGRIIPTLLGKGVGISRNWATAHFLAFYGQPRTVMAPVGVSFSISKCIIIAHNEAQGPLEVESSTILGLIGSNQFMSYHQWLCHYFKVSALTPSLLFHSEEDKGVLGTLLRETISFLFLFFFFFFYFEKSRHLEGVHL